MKQKKKAAKFGEEFDDYKQDNSLLEEMPPGFDKQGKQINTFNIKTIQFFNRDAEPINKEPILVEIVHGEFSDNRIYDVSITQFKDKVYFFRRFYGNSNGLDVSLQDVSDNDNSMVRLDQSMMSDISDKDILQLFSFQLSEP